MNELSHLLDLAEEANAAKNSPVWKSNIDAALNRHGSACDAVWAELDRLIAARKAADA